MTVEEFKWLDTEEQLAEYGESVHARSSNGYSHSMR